MKTLKTSAFSSSNFDAFANRHQVKPVTAVRKLEGWAAKPFKTTEQLERELIAMISKK